jgi:CDGSH-type Zn-finger protein
MTEAKRRIVIEKNASYRVEGSVPLVRKRQVVSEHGEPMTWVKEEVIETEETYWLCRCGGSSDKPFCDGSHRKDKYDGTETADTGSTAERQETYPGSTGIVIRRDYSLCTSAGFCGNRLAGIEKIATQTEESIVRAQAIAMIERCPSGSLTYAFEDGGPDVEPDLPQQIAVTTEILDSGPVAGPLWVTGGIPIERSDGQPFETRNRVTLCNCGRSGNKPLCDGSHRQPQE